MPLISIRERGINHNGPVVAIDGQEHPLPQPLAPPFDERAERELEWYFEEHLRFPFTNGVRFQAVAARIPGYGEALFDQLFADRRCYARYQALIQQGMGNLTFEVAGGTEFQRLHWEALKDPDLPQAFALQSTFVRRNLQPRALEANLRPSPTINLLVVTARPGGRNDVGYRTISRPLIGALRQANVPVQVDILRPATYAALVQHLEEKQDSAGAGYYHVIHFDVHGALLPFAKFDEYQQAQADKSKTAPQLDPYLYRQEGRYGRPKLAEYAGVKAFLFLESGVPGLADPVEATELADLLLTHQIPIAILNACQSGKYVQASVDSGESDSGESDSDLDESRITHHASRSTQETSLGSQLMAAGMQMVLAMGYSVTVSAAEIMMERLYAQLFVSGDVAAAIRAARLELHNRKARRVYFNQQIELEDWLLPVVYENQRQRLQTRDFTEEEANAYYEAQATAYQEPHITYGFVGRDLDILQIERQLLRQADGREQNILLIQGMGGTGKSTLLHHLAAWWQGTGFVQGVAYFGYDERKWTVQQILDALARQLLDEGSYRRQFQPLSTVAQGQFLAQRLNATRHLLILDNLESITGTNLAILNTLEPAEQQALHAFLRTLAGGKTLVLLGSRGNEAWLAPGTFDGNRYELHGLDKEAATTLADRILSRHNATHYRGRAGMQQDLDRLITLLNGHPLALEVVLANLARQTPAEVLAALQQGDIALDDSRITHHASRTNSILACIDYSHANLSPDAQQLLLCLAPFTGVINRNWLPQYTNHLITQSPLAHLPFNRWDKVIDEAINWGLLTPDGQMDGYLRVQPIFPYFLRTRLEGEDALRQAVETAFRQQYDDIGNALHSGITANEPDQRQTGLVLTRIEFENLSNALQLALRDQSEFFSQYEALFRYFNAQNGHAQAAQLSEQVLAAQPTYTQEKMTNDIARDFYLTYARAAYSYLEQNNYAKAETLYQDSIDYIAQLSEVSDETRANYRAGAYHELGRVAEEQRQWGQAEAHYQQALALFIEFNDRYSQASTYHQLGVVAQEQREWVQAEAHYQQALAIDIEFNNRHGQAGTYHQLGRVAQEQRQWAQAAAHYQQALALKIEFNDRYSQAGTYHNLGIVAQEQRQWAQAEAHYQQALAIDIEFNNRHGQALTLHALGSVALEQQQYDQAKQYFDQVVEQYIEFKERYWLASAYHQLGRIAEAQEQWEQASGYFLKDLQLSTEFADSRDSSATIRNLARLHRAGGDGDLPAAVAGVLGVTPAEVVGLFAQALGDVEE